MVNFNSNFPSNDNLPPELRAKIEAALESSGGDINALKSVLNKTQDDYNRTPQAELGGFTPDMLFALQRHDWMESDCPLKLSDPDATQVAHALFFQQTRTFLIAVRDSGGIKATAKRNLPRSFVNTMVDVFLNAEQKDLTLSMNKVLNEQDLFPLHEARIVCQVAGLIGLTKGRFNLRKKTLPLLEPGASGQLYKKLFFAFFRKYNIGYRFGGLDLDWLQFESGYILMPLQQHANKWIDPSAHTETWLHPMALERLQDQLSDISYMSASNAIERYFIEPFEKWGLLEVERVKKGYFDTIRRIRKTPLFDAFIHYEA